MRYIFFGSSDFSAFIARCLIQAGYAPLAFITNPDKPTGRKQILTPTPIKVLAESEKLSCLQPENLEEIRPKLHDLRLDFGILADYGKILPPSVLQVPQLGIIGIHVSLLPKYRGPSPMQTAILNGETETGITLYLMDEKIDTGPILAQEKIDLTSQTFAELRQEMAAISCNLLKKILPDFVAGQIVPQPQNHTLATYTKKFISDDGFVKPEDINTALSGNLSVAKKIWQKIRALNPEPGVWTWSQALKNVLQLTEGKRVKLLEAQIQDSCLVLKQIQVEGRTSVRL